MYEVQAITTGAEVIETIAKSIQKDITRNKISLDVLSHDIEIIRKWTERIKEAAGGLGIKDE